MISLDIVLIERRQADRSTACFGEARRAVGCLRATRSCGRSSGELFDAGPALVSVEEGCDSLGFFQEFRESPRATSRVIEPSARAFSCWRSRISPTTASPDSRGKLSAHRDERTTSAIRATLSHQLGPFRVGGSRISPTTASPDSRGKRRAHRIKRTTSAIRASGESRGHDDE